MLRIIHVYINMKIGHGCIIFYQRLSVKNSYIFDASIKKLEMILHHYISVIIS